MGKFDPLLAIGTSSSGVPSFMKGISVHKWIFWLGIGFNWANVGLFQKLA